MEESDKHTQMLMTTKTHEAKVKWETAVEKMTNCQLVRLNFEADCDLHGKSRRNWFDRVEYKSPLWTLPIARMEGTSFDLVRVSPQNHGLGDTS